MEAATNLWADVSVGLLGEEPVADGEIDWFSTTSAGWEEFKKTLGPIAASFAELLYNLWGGEYNEELTVLAAQALNGPVQPWHK